MASCLPDENHPGLEAARQKLVKLTERLQGNKQELADKQGRLRSLMDAKVTQLSDNDYVGGNDSIPWFCVKDGKVTQLSDSDHPLGKDSIPVCVKDGKLTCLHDSDYDCRSDYVPFFCFKASKMRY